MSEIPGPMDLEMRRRNSFSPASQAGLLAGLFGAGMLLSQILVSAIVFSGSSSIADAISMIQNPDAEGIRLLKIGQLIAAVVTFLVPSIVFTLILRTPPLPYLRVQSPPFYSSILTIFAVLFSLPLIAFVAELNAHLPLPELLLTLEKNAEQLTRAFLASEGTSDLLANLAIVGLAAAVTEEVFFRGCLQRILVSWVRNHHAAIWITAFFFSLLHMQFLGFFPRMLLGALMGYLFFWSGSLWIPILAHFVNNGTGVWVNYLVQMEKIPSEVETYGTSGAHWPGIILGSLLLFLILWFFPKKKNDSGPPDRAQVHQV